MLGWTAADVIPFRRRALETDEFLLTMPRINRLQSEFEARRYVPFVMMKLFRPIMQQQLSPESVVNRQTTVPCLKP